MECDNIKPTVVPTTVIRDRVKITDPITGETAIMNNDRAIGASNKVGKEPEKEKVVFTPAPSANKHSDIEDIKKTRAFVDSIDTAIALENTSGLTFTVISSEEYRVYEFPDNSIKIKSPQYLNVSNNGHRLLDADGISHYIPFGWRHLYWKALPGKPHFVK